MAVTAIVDRARAELREADLRRRLRELLRIRFTPWSVAALVAALLVLLPLGAVVAGVLGEPSPTWRHLSATVLGEYVLNSLLLMVGVGVLSLLFGVSTAWLVAACRFPGRRVFEWALILPLAVPTYIVAYVYAELVGFGGLLAFLLGPGSASLSTLRGAVASLPGASLLLALVLYPYVYLVTRASFHQQSGAVLESARILGRSPRETFFRIALPLARPAIVAGLTLVLMEVLNEYGAVKYLGIPTFTTGIFRAWFPLGDVDSAMRLSGILLVFVMTLILLERAQRGRARFSESSGGRKAVSRIPLRGMRGWGATAACAVPVLLGFVVPLVQLLVWAGRIPESAGGPRFGVLAVRSFGLAAAAALVTVGVALVVAYAARIHRAPLLRLASRTAGLGYAVPGAVIAVGVFVPFVRLDRSVGRAVGASLGIDWGLLLSGTAAALLFAYVVRFLAVALNPVRSGFERVCGNLDESARSLGSGPLATLWRIDLPLLRGVLVSAGLLVFVDVLKELPLTLMLRPFNFDTLATRAYQLATDEMLAESALPALLIIATGLIPVILLNRLIGGGGRSEEIKP